MLAILAAFLTGAAVAGATAALVFRRVMQRRLARQRAAEERARKAEQRAYAAGLAGRLIHEIKNPLNTLSMNLQLLAEDWAQAEDLKERRALKRINRLQSETARLNAILNDFMGFLREQKLALATVSVNQVLEETATFVRPALEAKGIQLRTAFGDVPPTALDPNRFKQALLNLILNAEDAVAQSAVREIMLRSDAQPDGVRVDVIDTGRGIPAEIQAKVFEPFFSTREGGTGLGLPTTRRIVEEHGGALEVHSEPGKGSCFTIKLPPAPDPAPITGGE